MKTPRNVWQRLQSLEGIDFDACATPLAAVSEGGEGGGAVQCGVLGVLGLGTSLV